ncbi:phosphoglycerate mutase-like protein [Peniophora sp. CONT]|nr:phosphoglycerate mutase-like protein [Peniophora sp. CONT]
MFASSLYALATAATLVRASAIGSRSYAGDAVAANRLSAYDGVELVHVRRQVPDADTIHFNVLHHLSGIAPYFDSPGVGLQPQVPTGCSVEGASYLLRHGDIYANDFDYESYLEPFGSKVANYSSKTDFANFAPLSFLQSWSTPITNETEQVEKLTPTGAADAQALGRLFAKRYASLLASTSEGENVTLWAASSDRSTQTAQNFIQGLGSNTTTSLALQIIQEEEDQGADTLTPHESCDTYEGGSGSEQSAAWRKVFTAAPIARFNAAVPGFNFTETDIVAMMEFCGYEMVINNSSNFCSFDIFTPEEWLGFEYMNDIMYNYNIGYGFTASPALGTPWLSATASALGLGNGTINETTSTQSLFLSFSHREEPAFIASALGLFNDSGVTGAPINESLPTDRINYDRAWRTSRLLPFLGHVGLERLTCTNETGAQEGTYVRAIVNGAPIPLPSPCNQDGPGDSCSGADFQTFVQTRSEMYDFATACANTEGEDDISFFSNITTAMTPQQLQ